MFWRYALAHNTDRRRGARLRAAGPGGARSLGVVVRGCRYRCTMWDELTGNEQAVAVLRSAATANDVGGPSDSLTHAWLITGPPGSGRSNLAFAFAGALLAADSRDAEGVRAQVAARTHPDLVALRTQTVVITIDEIRALVAKSSYAPSVARFRVVVIEDADRMSERTSNVLLKALEEPPVRTIWILCAPFETDLLPTIRSRVRTVRLSAPSIDDVASLLNRRDGIDAELAERVAREAQCHIGMARRLATDSGARERRESVLSSVLDIDSVTSAVTCAAHLLEIAGDDAAHVAQAQTAEDRTAFLRSLGLESGDAIPAGVRSQVRAFDDEQKRRATRSLRDGIDRVLVDLHALFRDIVMIQLGWRDTLINREHGARLDAVAARTTPQHTLGVVDALREARLRIAGNVAPVLALEAALVSVVPEEALCVT